MEKDMPQAPHSSDCYHINEAVAAIGNSKLR
jgi:hypothetical protein